MLLFIIVPILIAAIKKYPVSLLFKIPDLYPLFIIECVHLFFQISFMFGITYFVKYASLLQNLFLLSLIFPILHQKLYIPAFAGVGLTFLGTILNNIVINANDGHMPVYPTLSKLTGYVTPEQFSGSVDSLHILMTGSSKLNFLADYIDIGYCILSPGDIFIHCFASIIIYFTLKNLKLKKS